MRRRAAMVALAVGLAGILPAAMAEEGGGAPALLLAQAYRPSVDPSAFWISEKFDGVRAAWDGRELRFRSGRRVPAPEWFVAALPLTPLDGELWLGRGRFDELSAIVRRSQPDDEEWRRVRYMIFELPGGAGTFSERVDRLREILQAANVPWLRMVEQFRVANREELGRRFAEVVRAGGEGLMLHRAEAPYRTGRSDDLLKLKPQPDAEAVVVGHEPGRGRFAGMTGALRMRMPDGKHFRLGSGLAESLRREPPPLGAVVTYRYQELTKEGLPRFPRYWRQREEF